MNIAHGRVHGMFCTLDRLAVALDHFIRRGSRQLQFSSRSGQRGSVEVNND